MAEAPMGPCRKCGCTFELKPYQAKKNSNLCPPCRRAYVRDYTRRRKAEGRPIPRRRSSRKKEREKARRHRRKPEVKAKMRRERRKKMQSDPEFRRKVRARERVRGAIRSGRLEKEPCEVCGGTERIHAHHDDYDRPLDVRWLCALHHTQLHRDEEAA